LDFLVQILQKKNISYMILSKILISETENDVFLGYKKTCFPRKKILFIL